MFTPRALHQNLTKIPVLTSVVQRACGQQAAK